MQKAEIKCPICNITLVTVLKEDINADDIALYQIQTDCDQQHQSIVVDVSDV